MHEVHRSKDHLDTPGCEEPNKSEFLRITDPAHPLWGREFRIALIPYRTQSPTCVFVEFEQGLQIRIPWSATSLRTSEPVRSYSRISLASLEDFVAECREVQIECEKIEEDLGKG